MSEFVYLYRMTSLDSHSPSIPHVTGELKFPDISHDRIDSLVPVFGAKGARLILTNEILPQLNNLEDLPMKVVISPFEIIPTMVHERFLAGRSIEESLGIYFDSLGGGEYSLMVRSSAVFSEDSSERTGAGIYDSVKLEAGASFSDFYRAVIDVYRSVDSERAVSYRQSNQVPDERMAIVVQHYVACSPTPSKSSEVGTMNTIACGVPEIIEICSNTGLRPLIRREDWSPHYALDAGLYSLHLAKRLAKMGVMFEQVFDEGPLQIEYITEDGGEFSLLQVRPLPQRYQETIKIQFPKEETPVFSGRGAGVGDMILDVRPPLAGPFTTEEMVLVVFDGSYRTSVSRWFDSQLCLPKCGAVLVCSPSLIWGGHLETLALERGLICIYPEYLTDVDLVEEMTSKGGEIKKGLLNLGRVRVVSNGIRGAVYSIPDAPNINA